jgi:hypothetical protein
VEHGRGTETADARLADPTLFRVQPFEMGEEHGSQITEAGRSNKTRFLFRSQPASASLSLVWRGASRAEATTGMLRSGEESS